MRSILASVIAVAVLSSGVTAHHPVVSHQSNDTVYITKTGEKYHRESCRTLKRSKQKTPIKRSDAEAKGFTACKVCAP